MSGITSQSWRHNNGDITVEVCGGRGRGKFAESAARYHLSSDEDLVLIEAEHPIYVFSAVAKEERVVFRKFRDGEVIALFPDQYDKRTGMIGSYMHNGQHSDTVPHFGDTKPADVPDYIDLYQELIRQGYKNLNIVKRLNIKR